MNCSCTDHEHYDPANYGRCAFELEDGAACSCVLPMNILGELDLPSQGIPMKLLLRTPTVRFFHYGRNLIIEQEGQKIVIERADIPEALAAVLYIAGVETVPLDEIDKCCRLLEVQPPSMSAPTEKPSKKIEKDVEFGIGIGIGMVAKGADGRKYVIRTDAHAQLAQIEGHEFVCEKPHQDGDLSYLCGGQWCRCLT